MAKMEITIPAITCANCTMARIAGESPRCIAEASPLRIDKNAGLAKPDKKLKVKKMTGKKR